MTAYRTVWAAWVLLGALWGCGGQADSVPPAAPVRVAIIGWDGAGWNVLDPLLREGRLPHLQALLEHGARGRVVVEPPIFSPVVWTTLATGFPPSEHGITGFLLADPRDPTRRVLASSFHRRRAPLWWIASQAGRTVGFVAWWTSWPAEPVKGYLVSDHLAYNRWAAWARLAEGENYSLAYPPELEGELRALAQEAQRYDEALLRALVPFNEAELREAREATRPVMFHAPSAFRFGLATDRGNAAIARHLLETRKQPDLFSVTFILGDVAGHLFWHHWEPEAFPPYPEPGRLREAIPNVWAQLDRWTGEILERLDPRTLVVLVSDHGMRASGALPAPGRRPAGDHDPHGILVLSGPGVAAGADLGEVPALDFAPSVLALLGAPVGRDMPGRVHVSWLPPSTTVRYVDSWGAGPAVSAETSPAEQAVRDRLKSLGYISE